MIMTPYRYTPLSSSRDRTRLLRLLPHPDRNANIKCELFEYTLENQGDTHLYDALSYVWGDSKNKPCIFIHGSRFEVTENLHAALSQLRNHSIERILWVDAICINQEDMSEKEHQIQFMAAIYGQANRTLVWLGEAASNSDLIFQEIRNVHGKMSTAVVDKLSLQQAGLALLHRPWFRRIWILQEVAAARNIVIMCGDQKMDGYAFCLGIDSMIASYKASSDLQNLIRSVLYLIRESLFRPAFRKSIIGRSTLDICPLSGLVDMYHAHDATDCRDKVFALLGMSSDDLSQGSLSPNYQISWAELMGRLVKHVISDEIVVETWDNHQAAVIKSTGCIIGDIVSVGSDSARSDRLVVEVRITDKPEQLLRKYHPRTTWTLQASSATIKIGDVICLLQGASRPTIVRLHKDYCTIVLVAITFLEEIQRNIEPVKWPVEWMRSSFPDRNFLIVWDWRRSSESSRCPEEFDGWKNASRWGPKPPELNINDSFILATRVWDVVLLLGDLTVLLDSVSSLTMEQRGREAVKYCEMALKHGLSGDIKYQNHHIPQAYATGRRNTAPEAVVKLLLADKSVDPKMEAESHRPKPLAWAIEGGHDEVVEALFNCAIEAPEGILLKAAKKGYEVVVRLLLERSTPNLEAETSTGETALWLAADSGNEGIVRLLLETGNVDVDAKHRHSKQTPLSRAAESGYEAVVKLLLETGKVNIDETDAYGDTPLLRAVTGGHEAVVKLLLDTRKVNVESKDRAGCTALSLAAHGGHEAVVRLLLEQGKADIHAKDSLGSTPLARAVGQQNANRMSSLELRRLEDEWGYIDQSEEQRSGLEATIALLRAASKAAADRRKSGNPPTTLLSRTVTKGRKSIVKLRQLGTMQ
ncbi:hypothetical protein HBI49_074980 [Parastagonospora nodorum]|nr:hypothetical protein HBI49_074980 [Parastagonospora nodorum]